MRNAFEEEVYKHLAKEYGRNNVQYEAASFPYTLSYSYTPDFVVSDGNTAFYVEAKGYFRPDNRRTMVAVRDQTPNLDLRIIFQRNSKLSKNGKQRYSDWADKHNFSHCIGTSHIADLL